MKKLINLVLFFIVFQTLAQNKQILYNFAELPQTLLLNPASEVNYKFHAGVPLLSGISSDFGSKGVVLSDIFANDNRSINDKIAEAIGNLSYRDFTKINTQIEILNAGFRLKDDYYLSFGFYQELDAIGYYPKDALDFISEGNAPHINRAFSAAGIRYKADFLGVLHAGISKKVDDKLTIGGRFKIYSSALNVESNNNTGLFTTTGGTNNIYTHYLTDVNLKFKTSGLIENNEYITDVNSYLKNTFFGSNLGLGIDVGVTYRITPQLEFSGSILDLGFINHKKNTKNTSITGNFVFEGVALEFDNDNNFENWDEIDQRFQDEIPITDDFESYISWRPTKLNLALKYSFGDYRSKICYDNTYKNFYTDALGVQLYNVFRPLSSQLALTGFYEKAITNKIHTKVTYTVDDFSYSNIGAGLSIQLGSFNFYGLVDNLLEYGDLSSTNSASFQLGFNLIFN